MPTTNETAEPSEERFSRNDVQRMIDDALKARDKQHDQETSRLRAALPPNTVPAHGGGPGIGNHRPSWSKAEQEAAQRGEDMEHWHDD